jgi:hypothetical protein
MTIVTLGDKYYIPFFGGFKEITKEMAMHLYEENLITQEVPLEYEID